MSPQAKVKPKADNVVEAILPIAEPKKHSTKYVEADEAGQDVTNIYLKAAGVRKLGNPKAVKITVEAYDGE